MRERVFWPRRPQEEDLLSIACAGLNPAGDTSFFNPTVDTVYRQTYNIYKLPPSQSFWPFLLLVASNVQRMKSRSRAL